jgi:uncharacterized protein YdeI (YjbR/CyaY-like superfamily)
MDLPAKLFKDLHAWEHWLSTHFSTSPGLYLRIAKKTSGKHSVSYQEAVEVALCYGWIDGLKKPLDEQYWLQRFTPRGPKSIWSKINRTKALALIDEGRMQASGIASIERAKKHGRWESAYDSHSTAVPSAEFQAELDSHPKAKEFFATLNSQNRYSVLVRIQTAHTEKTRRKRIDQYIAMLDRHELLHP